MFLWPQLTDHCFLIIFRIRQSGIFSSRGDHWNGTYHLPPRLRSSHNEGSIRTNLCPVGVCPTPGPQGSALRIICSNRARIWSSLCRKSWTARTCWMAKQRATAATASSANTTTTPAPATSSQQQGSILQNFSVVTDSCDVKIWSFHNNTKSMCRVIHSNLLTS